MSNWWGFFLILCGFGFGVLGFMDNQQLSKSSGWHLTQGVITRVNDNQVGDWVDQSNHTSLRQYNQLVAPKTVDYKYSADKSAYEGHLVLYAGNMVHGEQQGPSIIVRYDPRQPEVSVLPTLLAEHFKLMMILGGIGVVAGLLGPGLYQAMNPSESKRSSSRWGHDL